MQYGSRVLIDAFTCHCQPVVFVSLKDPKHTFGYLHVGYGLPLVHGHEPPSIASTPTTEVDDEFIRIAAQSRQHGAEPFLTKFSI